MVVRGGLEEEKTKGTMFLEMMAEKVGLVIKNEKEVPTAYNKGFITKKGL